MKIRRRNGWILLTAWLPLLLVLFNFPIDARTLEAQTPGASGAVRPYDEAEAQAIDRQIMCPVCPAESIDQAQVPIARQMRQMVRDQLTQGAARRRYWNSSPNVTDQTFSPRRPNRGSTCWPGFFRW